MKIIENPKVKIPRHLYEQYFWDNKFKDCVLNLSDGWIYDSSGKEKIQRITIEKSKNYHQDELKKIDIRWFVDIKKTEKLYQSLKDKRLRIWKKIQKTIENIGKNKDIVVIWGVRDNESVYYKIEWNKDRTSFSFCYGDSVPDKKYGKSYKCQNFIKFLDFERKILNIQGLVGWILGKSINLYLSEKADELCEQFNKEKFSKTDYRMYTPEFLDKHHILTINLNDRKYRYFGEYKSFEPIETTEVVI